MKKKYLILTLSLILMASPLTAQAWSLKDMLSRAGETLKDSSEENKSSGLLGLVDALFSNSDFDVSRLEGTWEVTGSAAALKGENALANLGGKAGTAYIESQLDPYYKNYGLTGGTVTFDKEGNFTLKLKRTSIKGKVEKTGESTFKTTFLAFGKTKLAAMDTYFEKGVTGQTLNILYDSSKALTLLQGISSFVKMKSIQAVSALLSNYEDLYLGFKLKKVSSN